MFRTPITSSELRQASIVGDWEIQSLSRAGCHGQEYQTFDKYLLTPDSSPLDGIMGPESRELITFARDQALASSRTLNAFRMPAGDHAFLFDIPIPNKIFETVTGPRHQYHTYCVQAVIERRLKSDFVVSQPIRIYQVSDLETTYLRPHCPLTIEGHSAQDIQYCISIPDRNVPFGSTFPVECWFAPLMKDTKLSSVTIKVVEKQTARLEATASESVRHNVRFLTTAHSESVFRKAIDFSQRDESVDDFAELEWRFSTPVSLPKNFDACSQSIASKYIKITHELIVTAEFGNEAGHVTAKITETLPFKVHMTLNLPGAEAAGRRPNHECIQGNQNPPPAYNEHFSDLVVLASTQLSLCEHPMLAEITSARSSSEQSATDQSVDPSPDTRKPYR
ncbi:hypothetical protein N7457_006258, partial [Penicillium paradoxum]|uniref:uncharacterized protein n=1 Tax=Penicillium paradoxum TaxID=176176 RepID=UPI00254841AA